VIRVATWNINGVRARLETALAYLRGHGPDIVCLQEIKCADEAFPKTVFEDLGYNVATHGQKSFNGVAILSKSRLDETRRGLPGGDGDAQARYIDATVSLPWGALRVASIYLPNGNPLGTEKFAYKLAWTARLAARARDLLAGETPTIVAGDFNVIPEPLDARHPEEWKRDALFQPESRAAYRALLHQGWTDGTRACHPGPGVYTFYDYQSGAWQKDNGVRIDHLLLSPGAADLMASAGIDRFTRGWDKPSDHAPAWVDLRPGSCAASA